MTLKTSETKRSEMKNFLIKLIRGYQYLISPLLGHRCRFFPSCSHYATEAISRYGSTKGSYLAVKRIFKCHPFHPGGYDPVPGTEAGKEKNKQKLREEQEKS